MAQCSLRRLLGLLPVSWAAAARAGATHLQGMSCVSRTAGHGQCRLTCCRETLWLPGCISQYVKPALSGAPPLPLPPPRGLFQEINGCVSTGKEANVYHASSADGADLAIKVYKTSILVFKDRDRWAGAQQGRVAWPGGQKHAVPVCTAG